MSTSSEFSACILAVLIGKAVPYTRPGSRSAIAKTPVSGPVQCDKLGFVGDEQGDLRVHGGETKAIHLYAHAHYAWWRQQLGELDHLRNYGAFGENLAIGGATETDICLGDRLRAGSALLEVSQGRQPCWKLSD